MLLARLGKIRESRSSYRDSGLHVGSLRADVAYFTKEANRTRAALDAFHTG